MVDKTTSPTDKDAKPNRDCLAKAKPGEPMFIILGRDPVAYEVLRRWCALRQECIDVGELPDDQNERDHIASVRQIAEEMRAWRMSHGK